MRLATVPNPNYKHDTAVSMVNQCERFAPAGRIASDGLDQRMSASPSFSSELLAEGIFALSELIERAPVRRNYN